MGNDICNCNFLDDEEKKEENISFIQNQQLSIISRKKLKNYRHTFYVGSSKVELYGNGELDKKPSIKIKQLYVMNRLKFLSKKIRQFLLRKRINMTIGSVVTTNNDDNTPRFNTILSTKRKNNLNTDTGEVAFKNLSLIKNQNYKEKINKRMFNDDDIYNEGDGVIYLKLIDDSELEGIYYNNALNGFARVFYSNNDTYKGELFDDIANGYGIYYFSRQGCAYEGYWENNYKKGIGVENWWYEAVYEGEFKNGKKNGIGIYKWKDDSIYYGEWFNNNIHGFGVFKNKTKKMYKGQFVMNSLNGYGEMTYYKDNSFYYGFWSKNKRNGFGVELSPRKDGGDKIYVGFWENDDRYGYGILLNKKEDEKNIYAVWKKNKISKEFYFFEEFSQSIKQLGLEKYLFFFERTFDEHISIIKNINNHGD